MGDCLRNELLYSEKRPRDILFRAIERIVWDAAKTGEPKIVSRVTREAATAKMFATEAAQSRRESDVVRGRAPQCSRRSDPG